MPAARRHAYVSSNQLAYSTDMQLVELINHIFIKVTKGHHPGSGLVAVGDA